MPSISLPAIGASLAASVPALTAGSALLGAAGTAYTGIANSEAMSYQAQVAQNNAKIAQQNATYSLEAGNEKVQQAGIRAAEEGGEVKTALAANNVDVNTGSALDVETGTREKGALNELTTEEDAELQAYGYKTQATDFEAQAGLDTAASENDLVGAGLGSAGTLFSGASALGGKWTGVSSSGSGNQGPELVGNPG